MNDHIESSCKKKERVVFVWVSETNDRERASFTASGTKTRQCKTYPWADGNFFPAAVILADK
jgi:hypothetical protein